MSAVKESVDISRRPGDIYSYVTDPTHLMEWQESVVSVRPLDEPPLRVGSRVVVTRRLGGREFPMTMEVTDIDPPYSWHLRGSGGPVRSEVQGTIEPLGDGERSRLTIDVDFEGQGMGKLLVPLVVQPKARKEIQRDELKLKELLESGAA
ncbi:MULTISPECIES: SRPBCC family protein [unclassified Streptomyces]|uniref:SRPBCC family protein n=1 Tax=unclassified Streptomyces TaxID=2593676 RepID=UPI002E1192C1|nr:SRPBCC family protein [Streptomyces sp. NBC_01236]